MVNVESDLRNMGVQIWRTIALDRNEWVSVMRVTKIKLERSMMLKKKKVKKKYCHPFDLRSLSSSVLFDKMKQPLCG